MRERGIGRVITTASPSPGFIGEGHTAVTVVDPNGFNQNDPFIALMDDRIDLVPGRPAGGAHPHAGFETVTFVVEGRLRDRDEGTLEAGDVLWMTAGSGVIHNEDSEPLGKTRILQLWLTLPQRTRWAAPRFELIRRDEAPIRREPGVVARVYSGSSGPLRATTHNYVPVALLDVRIDAGAKFTQRVEDSFNGFVYVLEGNVAVGAQATALSTGQVAWLADPPGESCESCESGESGKLGELGELGELGKSVVTMTGGERGARFMLYAGERQNVPIVMHGPFVAESRADLMRLSRMYVEGAMPRLSELPQVAKSQ